MRRSDLARLDSDWHKRDLFRKKNRMGKYLWPIILLVVGISLYQARQDIPDLLLDSFKLIAHLVPAQTTPVH